VVPSELGYGWYCGNSYGYYWVKSLSSLCIHVLCQFKWLCCLKIDINFFRRGEHVIGRALQGEKHSVYIWGNVPGI
jgi:hypothetical protein